VSKKLTLFEKLCEIFVPLVPFLQKYCYLCNIIIYYYYCLRQEIKEEILLKKSLGRKPFPHPDFLKDF